MTPSEKYVAELCEKSFLPFWSFPNPIGKKNKELCDVFVVCENTIIIISVKDIRVSENSDESINYERWIKKAIHNSVDQIYGAERFLKSANEVLLKDRKTKIKLPPKESRIIHRIAIAFGSKDEYPLPTGNFGYGYVNVFDENSTSVILSELDTITDFTKYLIAKENFEKHKTILIPREIDFLAFYLQTGLELEQMPDVIACENNLWESYVESIEYQKWKDDILGSYVWDYMIWDLFNLHIINNASDQPRHEIEESIRLINLEPRINRIVLGEMLSETIKSGIRARMLGPLENSNHSYVFMPRNDESFEMNRGELILRCDIARYEFSQAEKVVGISFGNNENGQLLFDICYIHIPEIDDNFVTHIKRIKRELKYFIKIKRSDENE